MPTSTGRPRLRESPSHAGRHPPTIQQQSGRGWRQCRLDPGEMQLTWPLCQAEGGRSPSPVVLVAENNQTSQTAPCRTRGIATKTQGPPRTSQTEKGPKWEASTRHRLRHQRPRTCTTTICAPRGLSHPPVPSHLWPWQHVVHSPADAINLVSAPRASGESNSEHSPHLCLPH